MVVDTSLKGCIQELACLVGTTPAALYERQRELVRTGLLASSGGRGPGSGVRATAQSVAILLISFLAADSLSESAARARTIATTKPTAGREISGKIRCPYTGMTTFCDALAAILGGTAKAAGVVDVVISRTAPRAVIRYYDRGDGHKTKAVEFAARTSTEEAGISVAATLSHSLLQLIAGDVQVAPAIVRDATSCRLLVKTGARTA